MNLEPASRVGSYQNQNGVQPIAAVLVVDNPDNRFAEHITQQEFNSRTYADDAFISFENSS